MMSNTEQLQYGECCCCLEKGDHRDLTKQYYEAIFKDTFNIVLKYPENSKLICDCCIVELKQASHFRCMVESTQQRLSDHVNWQPEFVNVKLELDLDIKNESDNPIEEADCDVQQFAYTNDELNYDAVEIDIKEENTDLSTSSDQKKTLKVLLTRCPAIERLHSSHKKRLFVCDFCQHKLVSASSLKEHIRTHTGEKPFSCHICEYKSSRKTSIKSHLLTHTGKKPFSCDNCQYKAASKYRLIEHLRTHTRNPLSVPVGIHTPFSCHICDFKSSRKSTLTVHLRSHTVEKPLHRTYMPFSCDRCEFKTTTRKTLDKHINTHSDRPYSCNVCPYRTAVESFLRQHMLTHPEPLSCDICPFRTQSKRYLNVHMVYTHCRKDIDISDDDS